MCQTDKSGRFCVMTRNQEEYKKTWMGEDLTHAKDVDNERVQDVLQLVVIWADVEALSPSLTDIQVANICCEAIIKSKITFTNINYRKAHLYIAINMNKLTKEHPLSGECCLEERVEVESGLVSQHPRTTRSTGSSRRWN